jgi:hypothetical protein
MVPASMLLQSYNDTIRVFPAIPAQWKDLEFYDLPAEGGIKVSGKMKDGKVQWIRLSRDNKELIHVKEMSSFAITRNKEKIHVSRVAHF